MNFVSHEKGVALLEFSIILPILSLFFFGAFEMSRGIYLNNLGVEFGQDVATALFHECKDKDLSDTYHYTTKAATDCLQEELPVLYQAFRKQQPRSAVIATIYRAGSTGIEMFAGPIRACESSTLDFSCDSIQSQFPLNRAQQEFSKTLAKTGWLVLVETYVKTDGSLERLLPIFNRETQTYYSATVF